MFPLFGESTPSGGFVDGDESSRRFLEIYGRSLEIYGRLSEIYGRSSEIFWEIVGDFREIVGDFREIVGDLWEIVGDLGRYKGRFFGLRGGGNDQPLYLFCENSFLRVDRGVDRWNQRPLHSSRSRVQNSGETGRISATLRPQAQQGVRGIGCVEVHGRSREITGRSRGDRCTKIKIK